MLRALRGFFALLLPLALAACAGGNLGAEFDNLNLNFGGAPAGISETALEGGGVRLVLEPVEVWDDEGAGELQLLPVADGGEEMTFRLRETDVFHPAWVRLGLYWDSRYDRVYMPAVIVGGPPVKIKQAQLRVDGRREVLHLTDKLNFTPAGGGGGGGLLGSAQKMYSGVFVFTPETLARLATAKGDAHVVVSTNRGGLRVNLAIAGGDSPAALAATGKYQFAQFYRRMQAAR